MSGGGRAPLFVQNVSALKLMRPSAATASDSFWSTRRTTAPVCSIFSFFRLPGHAGRPSGSAWNNAMYTLSTISERLNTFTGTDADTKVVDTDLLEDAVQGLDQQLRVGEHAERACRPRPRARGATGSSCR